MDNEYMINYLISVCLRWTQYNNKSKTNCQLLFRLLLSTTTPQPTNDKPTTNFLPLPNSRPRELPSSKTTTPSSIPPTNQVSPSQPHSMPPHKNPQSMINPNKISNKQSKQVLIPTSNNWIPSTHSLETMCLLMALKIKHPSQIHLLRGNHEDRWINSAFGFHTECISRLNEDPDNPVIFNTFNNSLITLLSLPAIHFLCGKGVFNTRHDN